jgi:Ca-activated chloride channel family protein
METAREEGGGDADRKLEELLAQRKRESGRDRRDSDSGGDDRGEEDTQASAPSDAEHDERRETSQADEQWLRRIPDDPGGLLRRKFYYQYSQSNRTPSSDTPW